MDSVEWLVIDDGSTDRTVDGRARARRGPHRPAHEQPRPRRRLPGRPRRLPQARRRRDREHRRRQPVPRRRHRRGSSSRSWPARPTWSSATARPTRSSTSRRSRSGSSASAARSCGAPPGTGVPDTTSGFRAYNREAALQLQVVSKFTYTLESLIQAGKMLVAVEHVPVRTNEQTRPSRLFPSMWSYVRRNGISIFRIYALYEPLRVFVAAAALVALVGVVIWVRFALVLPRGRGRRPHPVADPRLHAVHRRRPAARARGGRRHPRRQPRAPAADPRARPPGGAPARRGALALRAGRRRGRARGHHRRPVRRGHRQGAARGPTDPAREAVKL